MKLPREQVEAMVSELQAYLFSDHGLEWGNMAAEQLLMEVMKLVEPTIYNQAIRDARQVVLERISACEDELYSLEKPTR